MLRATSSICGSGVRVVRDVSAVSREPPGLGFTASPSPISQLPPVVPPPALWLVFTRSKHGQNATKLDQDRDIS